MKTLIYALLLCLVCATTALAGELSPFMDINEVLRIGVEADTLYFMSGNGYRQYNRKTGQWQLLLADFNEQSPYGENNIYGNNELSAKVPDWYTPRHSAIAMAEADGYQYLLVHRIGEVEAVADEIIDCQRKKVYSLPFMNCQVLATDGQYLWAGCKRGIIRIDIRSGERTDYIVFPRFDRIAGWVDCGPLRYIASREGLLFAYNPATGAIEQVVVPENIKRRFFLYENDAEYYSNYDSRSTQPGRLLQQTWIMTNPVVAHGKVYVGVMSGMLYGLAGAVLEYEPRSGNWNYHALPVNLALRSLLVANDRIWCIGNHIAMDEGGCYPVGGIAAITDTGAVITFPDINVPIIGHNIKGSALTLFSAEGYRESSFEHNGLAQIMRINMATLSITDSRAVELATTACGEFIPLRFTLSEAEEEALRLWRVRMRMVAVPRPRVPILSPADLATNSYCGSNEMLYYYVKP